MKDLHRCKLDTIAAHGVRAPSPESLPPGERGTPSVEPLFLTSVIDFESVEASLRPMSGEGGYVYARHGMPNGRSLELTLAALEGAEDALATSSGMAATACAVLAHAAAGDRVLLQADCYGGTSGLLFNDFAKLGITTDTFDAYDPNALAASIDDSTKLVIVESISNPLVRETDIAALAEVTRKHGVPLCVDATFATPVVARPLSQGADLVLHSATKYLGGHHDLCAGLLCGDRPMVERARGVARRFGSVAAPMDAWLAVRGIKTLGVRIERAQETAATLAERLRRHPKVIEVHYPGKGPLLSFDVGTLQGASTVVAALQLMTLTPSLGGTATGVSHPATSSHRALSPETRKSLGIGDGLLRISVGLEAEQDLWQDLDEALSKLG